MDAEGRAASEVVDFVCGDMGDDSGGVPAASFEVRPSTPEGTLRLLQSGRVLSEHDTPGGIAAYLACEVAREIAEVSTSGLLFHAAAVALGPHGVVMPGHSGSGKTTLTAHLVHEGFRYLTDELICVSVDGPTVEGFARPLSVKPGAWPALEHTLAATPDSEVLVTGDGFLVRPLHLTQMPAGGRSAIRACVFPRRTPGASGHLRRLTKAEAAMHLLAHCVNVRNLPDHGLAAVTGLARAVPAYEAVYDDAGTMVPAIRALFMQ